jgi:hypothetical protein
MLNYELMAALTNSKLKIHDSSQIAHPQWDIRAIVRGMAAPYNFW